MTVMARQARYHALGWAIRRVMNAPNVEASNLSEIAERVDPVYPADDKLISSYMRLRPLKDNEPERPRSIPPIEFIFALADVYDLHPEQREDLVLGWIAIQPDSRREAYRKMCETLSGTGHSSEAWREMLDFEADRNTRTGDEGNQGERPARSRDQGD